MAKGLKKVLIVDDEETLTWSMARSLSKDKDKFEVMIANNGKEALNLLQKNEIDLVISDIRMPDINGLDLLVKIKKEYPQTRVIIMTAYGSSDVQKEANRRGSLFYVEKPFEISDIRKIIIDLIGKKKGFQGKVFGLQLTDIIQMNCLSRLTTALIITRNGERGIIYLNEGEIIHAECGDQKGTDAFYKILGWQEGEFVSNIGATSPLQTIYQNWEHLLVEAMRRNDEQS
ncbi:MAG: response regulator [Syntrophaceae bacterium]|nr:response regulator [Syntrophaceae bacterium]